MEVSHVHTEIRGEEWLFRRCVLLTASRFRAFSTCTNAMAAGFSYKLAFAAGVFDIVYNGKLSKRLRHGRDGR